VAQRLQLEATARGLCSSYLNQAVEAPQACRALADWLGHRPVLILRFGHGTPLPSSFRRTVQQVMDRR
jgi:hypothetical protein